MIDKEEKMELKEIPWPYNLIELVSGLYAAGDYEVGQLDFTAKGILAYANTVLSPRELSVIQTRYGAFDGRIKSLKETGALHGVAAERCRQIEAKALRKMIYPRRLTQYAAVPWKCWKAERDARIAAENAAKEANERLRWVLEHCEYRMKPGIEPPNDLEDIERSRWPYPETMTVDEMDLSVRSFNCLKRAGYNTLGDLLKMEDPEEWTKIRNLGRKSMEEITKKVHSLGCKFRWETDG